MAYHYKISKLEIWDDITDVLNRVCFGGHNSPHLQAVVH